MKKRVMSLLLAVSLAATMFVGCGSSSTSNKSNDTKAESQSEEKDTSKESASGKTDDGKYVDVDAYLADENIKSQLDSALSSTEEGLNMEILSDKDTLIYKYTFADQLVTKDTNADSITASLEKTLDQQEAAMTNVANSLKNYIALDTVKVRVEYYDADGTALCDREYASK